METVAKLILYILLFIIIYLMGMRFLDSYQGGRCKTNQVIYVYKDMHAGYDYLYPLFKGDGK